MLKDRSLRLTRARPQIENLDQLPIPDRSLIDCRKYNQYIGETMVRNCISLLASRGCPYNCAYCHKIWPKRHVVRSAANIFEEIRFYYNLAVRKFSFFDDIFNFDIRNSTEFFRLIIKNKLDIQLFFPNGLRGDIMTEEYIDLMVEAGTVNAAFALETASPRLQKLIGKNLQVDKLHRNLEYICKKYPHVISELFIMIGFPTETEEEAIKSLDFLRSLKWVHFPVINVLKIYPGTDMAELALRKGVSCTAIARSDDLAYHNIPDTLPFDKSFVLRFKAGFFDDYFLAKERLLHILPYQMKVLNKDEFIQKYNSYLPVAIGSFEAFLDFTGIEKEQIGTAEFIEEEVDPLQGLNEKIREKSTLPKADENALRILLLDLSQLFRKDSKSGMVYDVVEQPLGLLYILTYLNQKFGTRVKGKIAKSRIDFDDFEGLHSLVREFAPHVIGMRTLTFFKDFFHQAAALLKKWRKDVPIIVGGPYATSDYERNLLDDNIDLVVLGEGEVTFCEIIEKIMEKGGKFPEESELEKIPGIVYVSNQTGTGAAEISLQDNGINNGTCGDLSAEKVKEILWHFNEDLENE